MIEFGLESIHQLENGYPTSTSTRVNHPMYLKNGFTQDRDDGWYLVARKRLETNV